ncbi:hypothetical protein D8B34_02505 [Verminephrobacter eiseniae]|nr:hypothetical protein [Verminephrobacter eiseniae]MCW8183172.1 hypothetical protein [Verminephrobacter eiseniae]MCW8222113.1 hypothetical protein [Verminephrobacter eiseniae]MCW8232707.1 hypothetical protein [Verminephrobacter eiseniae]
MASQSRQRAAVCGPSKDADFTSRRAGQGDATGERIVAPVRKTVPVIRQFDIGVGFAATRLDLRQQLLVSILRAAKLLSADFRLLIGDLVLRHPLFGFGIGAGQVLLQGIDLRWGRTQLLDGPGSTFLQPFALDVETGVTHRRERHDLRAQFQAPQTFIGDQPA